MYETSRETINKVRDKYGCKGEVIFRTAIQYIVDCGQQNFQDKDWVKSQLEIINAKHDMAEAEGKNLWLTREFEKALVECATELSDVNTYDLLIYIQKEVFWSHEGGLDYQRAIELLHSCMNWFVDYDCCETKEMLKRFNDLDFTDEELETLGLGWLFDTEEDE
jgi:hypothetical protein